MIAFDKPEIVYNYQLASQLLALDEYRLQKSGRDIPKKDTGNLLVASWNIANLGLHERREKDYRIIAHLIGWFDIMAIQEIADNLLGLRSILENLPNSYRCLFSDIGGNKERAAFIYDSNKVTLLEKVGEIAIPPSDNRYIKLPGIAQKFKGFDRNPYIASFQSGSFKFLLVNVHLYYGSDSTTDKNRRSLEAYAVGRWADLRRKKDYAYAKDIIVLGDFNLPKVQPGDAIYNALTKRGLRLPDHSTQIGSAIFTDNDYDQIAFFPGETAHEYSGTSGIFDFDGPLFNTLWNNLNDTQKPKIFNEYVRYYLSDHRIMWAEFRTQ